ncbi:MAG: ferrous iron transport protein A [Lachnospiraceae bacterium]|nr:ferrous iron transport protein A [Lachnospiraceae bacterium]MCI9657066.1 ferrous iron transport protein A [Lachnospiraceae bacterium]
MRLYEGQKGSTLQVVHMDLPLQTERRLEVLGMLEGTKITVVNRKKRGAMIIKIRGTRFAVGESITKSIEVKEA